MREQRVARYLRKCQFQRIESNGVSFTPETDQEPKSCTCTQGLRDLMRAAPPKRDWLRKTACPACKKEYWTNRESDYCFDCEYATSSKAGIT